MEHVLKSTPQEFEELNLGLRSSDVRSTEDRDFEPGDVVIFREYVPERGEWTGRWVRAIITHVAHGGRCEGVRQGFASLSLQLRQRGVARQHAA